MVLIVKHRTNFIACMITLESWSLLKGNFISKAEVILKRAAPTNKLKSKTVLVTNTTFWLKNH